MRPRRPPARRPAAPKPAARSERPKGSLFGLTVVFLVLGIVVLTALILLGGIVGNPDVGTPTPPGALLVTAEPTFQQLATSWVVTFQYRFENREWSLGEHPYTLQASCPSQPSLGGTWSTSFNVTADAPRYPQALYLRTRGVSDSLLDGRTVAEVHPNQLLEAAFSLLFTTQQQAQIALSACRVTVTLDGRTSQDLVAQPPYEH